MKILWTILLCVLYPLCFSQHTFTGKLLNELDEPIVGATIRVVDTQIGSVTDFDGSFKIEYAEPQADVIISALIFGSDSDIKKTIYANQNNLIVVSQKEFEIQPVFISTKYPVTENTLTAKERESMNLGQDIPILLEQLPSVVSTSDAGAGVGYTGIRVRGSDATRVNVTINGIPLNDSESQGVFWVNMPDFASSTGNITLVRGVGTSTNGAGAFGASLHLETEDIPTEAYAEYSGSVGSFNTWKNTIKFGSGKNNGWSANARLSKITSNGFIDRANSDLESYFVQAEKEYGNDSHNGSVQFITWKGNEETYQAWYGIPEGKLFGDSAEQQAHFDRNYFPGGTYQSVADSLNYFNSNARTYNIYEYENQVDDYTQEHYQLLANHHFSEQLHAKLGLHYTVGRGFFEEFRQDDSLSDYNLSSSFSETSDLVRRRWLDNDFYGFVSSFYWTNHKHDLNFGGGYNRYLGDHFGEVIQGEFVSQEAIGEHYYFNDAQKNDGNVYAKYTYDIDVFEGGVLRPFIDLQYRRVKYDFVGLALDGNGEIQSLPQLQVFDFFNPKFGLTYEANRHGAYFSFARAQKEPNRSDFVDSPADQLPVPEELNDFELGYSYGSSQFSPFFIAANLYYMDYKNQLAVTGGVNDVGAYTRVNVDDSYRAGIELESSLHFGNNISVGANATFSRNKIKSFVERIDDFDAGGQQLVEHMDTDLALSPNTIAAGQIAYKTKDDLFQARLIGKYVGKQFLDNTSTDARSIDAYFVNHFNTTLNLGRFTPDLEALQINLLVNNIWNTTYESNGYTFGYIAGGETIYENYYYPQAGANFLTGLTVRF